jgi:DNA (cytosine-5)-methyltransferase 1
MPGLAISASGSSSSRGRLLPSPAAGNFNDGEDLASWEARRQRNLAKGINGNGQGTPLPVAIAKLLPTPTSNISGRTPEQHMAMRRSIGRNTPSQLEAAIPLLFRTPTSQLAVNGGSQHPDKRKAGGHGPTLADEVEHLLPTPMTAYSTDSPAKWSERKSRANKGAQTNQISDLRVAIEHLLLPTPAARMSGEVVDWGPYARAVLRWAQVTGTLPPHPVEPGKTGMRLSPAFVEWMQGLPAGWVTAVPGLSRNAQLKALGNGVVPQSAALALAIMAPRVAVLSRSAA